MAKKPVKKSPKKAAAKKVAKKIVKKAAKKAPKKVAAKKTAAKKPAKKVAKTATKPVVKAVAKSTTKPIAKPTAKPQLSAALKTLTPLDDRIVVEVKDFEKMTAGGLYIPETADVSGNFKGVVVAAGKGHKDKKGRLRPMDVKAGDEVLFEQHSGTVMTLDGVEIRILRESEVFGIVESK